MNEIYLELYDIRAYGCPGLPFPRAQTARCQPLINGNKLDPFCNSLTPFPLVRGRGLLVPEGSSPRPFLPSAKRGDERGTSRPRLWATSKHPLVVLLAALVFLGCEPGIWAEGMALLVPAYFDPGQGRWPAVASAAQRVPLVAIANVNNGPGSGLTARPDYAKALSDLRAAGGQVVGYVYTQYGQRAVEAVKADMQRWHQLYPLDGFFVDEMANSPSPTLLKYYAALLLYARELNPAYRVIANPGTNTDESYLKQSTADVLVIFENDAGYANFAPAAWTKKYPPSAFGHLAYAIATADQMTNVVQLAAARRAGFIYVTDDSGANPWDTLPSYWGAEVSLVEGVNRAAAATAAAKLALQVDRGPGLTLSARGAVGRYILEAAAPLGDWQPLSTNLTNTGTSVWHLLNVPPNRFFRVRQE